MRALLSLLLCACALVASRAIANPDFEAEQAIEDFAPAADARGLPARRLSLEESWSQAPEVLTAGVPVTRILFLRAEGLAAEHLPPLAMQAQPVLDAYHDRPELFTERSAAGIVGHRIQRIVLMPLDEGAVQLPALSVHWWDVAADTARTATVPARTLRLQAPGTLAAPPAESPPALHWSVIRGFSAALLLVSALLLWWHISTQALRDVRQQLREACRRNDARGARDALVDWWKLAAPGSPVPLVQDIGRYWDARARAELDALDAALYARRAWDGKSFWRRVRPWLRGRPARPAHGVESEPPPLFRLHARDAAPRPAARS